MAWDDDAIKESSPEPVSPSRGFARNAYKEGIANTLGGIGDAPMRAFELVKALVGSQTVLPQAAADLTGRPQSDFIPEPNIARANMFTDYFRNLIGVDPELRPQTRTDKVISGIAGGVGASAIPVAGGASFTDFIRNYITQLAVGGSAGAGAEVAGLMTNDNPLAKVTGGLIAGVAVPSTMQTRGAQIDSARRALTAGQNPLDSERAATIAANVAQRNVRSAAAGISNAAGRIEQGLALQEKIPGFRPSIAEMLQEPQSGIAGMQRQFTRLTPENINRDIARREGSMDALSDYLSSLLPSGSSAQIRGEVNRVLASQGDDLAKQNTALAGSLPNVRQTAVGEVIQAAANAEKKAMQPAIRAAYDRAFAAAGNTRIPLDGVILKVEDLLGQKITQFQPETAPFTVRKLMDLVKEGEKSWNPVTGSSVTPRSVQAVSLKDLDGIRSAINADLRSASASLDPTAAMKLRNLSQVHGAIDEAVNASPLSAGAKQAYSDAITKYRTEFAPRFKEGLNSLMFKSNRLNEDAIRSDDIIGKYFKPGGETEATQLTRLLGSNAEGKEATRTGILDLYRNKVVNPQSGEVDFGAHSRFLQQYEKPLKILEDAGIDAGDAIRSSGREAARLSEMKMALNDAKSLLKFDTSEDLISSALKDPRTMQQLTGTLDARGKANLARTVMQEAYAGGKSSKEMLDFLTENQRTLMMAMSAASGPTVARKHFADLKDIQKGLSMLESVGSAASVARGGTDPLKSSTGVSIPTVWAQWRAVAAGRQGVGTAAAMVAGPAITRLSQVQFDDVMNKALNDPQTARALVEFLQASPIAANARGQKLLDVMRTVKDVAPTAVNALVGADKYKLNTGRSAMAIANSVQEPQE